MTSRGRVFLGRLGLVLLGTALEVLSAPPGPAPALVLVRDTPFLLLLWHAGGARWARWAYLYAFVLFAVGLRWLAHVHPAMPFTSAFVLAFTYVLWGGAIRWLVARRLAYPVVVGATAVLQEMLQTVVQGSSGMPWPARPLAFAGWPAALGAASLLGAYGLSFVAGAVSAVASGLPALGRRDAWRGARVSAWLAAALGVAALAGGLAVLGLAHRAQVQDRMTGPRPAMARTDPLVVIQGNVPQALKNERFDPGASQRIFDAHRRLTREAYETLLDEGRTPLAVLWPETMIPWPFLDASLARRFPADWANQHVVLENLRASVPPALEAREGPLLFLVGVARHLEGASGRHETLEAHDVTDSLLFLDARHVGPTIETPPDPPAEWRPSWERGVHHKTILVPWGEYAPGGSWLPPLRRLRDALSVIPEITPGAPDQEPFLLAWAPPATPGGPNRAVRVGTIVCFEIAFPSRCRAWRTRGATVLVNPGNYAWYGDSAMPAQVEALARLRAAELAVTLVVAGNTGPSCVVDPAGEVRARVSRAGATQFVEGWCASPLWSDAAWQTLYTRVGDTPWLLLGALLFGLGLGRSRHGRVTAFTGARAPGGPASQGRREGEGTANPSDVAG